MIVIDHSVPFPVLCAPRNMVLIVFRTQSNHASAYDLSCLNNAYHVTKEPARRLGLR